MKITNTIMIENDTHAYIVNADMYPLIIQAHPESFKKHTIHEMASSLVVIEKTLNRRVIKCWSF